MYVLCGLREKKLFVQPALSTLLRCSARVRSVMELSMSTFLKLLTPSPSCFDLMVQTLSLLTRLHTAAMRAKLFGVSCVSDFTSARVESVKRLASR